MAKACRVLRSAAPPKAPKAAHTQHKAKTAKAKAGKAAPTSHKSKVHHRKLKQHRHKTRHHARKVCGAQAA